MSITLMSQVYATKMGNANLKTVAVKLADYAHDDGTSIFPSLNTVAEHTELAKSTVQRSIRRLLKVGILEIDKDGGGRGKTTRYRFNLSALASAPKIVGGASKNVVTVTMLTKRKNMVTRDEKHGHGDHRTISNHKARSALSKKSTRPKVALSDAEHRERANQFADSLVEALAADDIDSRLYVRNFALRQYNAEHGGPDPSTDEDFRHYEQSRSMERTIARFQDASMAASRKGDSDLALRFINMVDALEARLDELMTKRSATRARRLRGSKSGAREAA